MKKLVFCFIFLLLIGIVSSECDSGQIDINSASATELDKIIYVGPATAENIINSRPFDSLDDLINVYGIGEIKLDAIINQDLACVEAPEGVPSAEGKDEEGTEESSPPLPPPPPLPPETGEKEEKIIVIKESEPIKLNSKDIKSEDSEINYKSSYMTYGFVVLCIFIVALFIMRFKKRKNALQ